MAFTPTPSPGDALPKIPGLTGTNGQSGPVGLAPGALRTPPAPKVPLRRAPGDSDVGGLELYQQLADGDPKGDAQLRNIVKSVREASLEGRELLERGWWQKLLYINGRQWIYHTPRGGWQDKRLARWIPRPVTNICAETVQTIRAMLSGIEPSLRVRPNGNEPVNVITAQMADELEPVINEEHAMQTRFFEADFWAPALGVAFLHPYWDRDSDRNQEFLQAMQCPTCGFQLHPLDIEEGKVTMCPQDGSTPAVAFQPAMDPATGDPIGDYETVGSGATDVLSPLEILIPTYCQRWEDVDRLIRVRWRPKSYYDGRPYADQIQYSSSVSERSLSMYRALALMTDLTTVSSGGGGAQPSRTEGAMEAELWIKPSADYPEGLWCRTVGGQHGEAVIIRDEERGIVPGPLPYRDFKDRPLWPWIYYQYEEVGGRLWGPSSLDPVIQKQDQLNRNDSMVELIMQRMANPIWLEPKGAEVQRFTGEPGLIVRYQVIAGTQAKPERLEGMSPPSAFFSLREQYLNDVERLAGTGDVLKGNNPAGVDSFSALQLLVERSQSRFTSLFKARGRAYRDWYAVALELERSYGPQLRTRSVMGQNRTWTFKTFQRQELQGAITVIIEDGSTAPKTSLGKRAALQQAQQMQFISPQDPDTQYAGLELLGVSEMAPGLDAHVKAAQMEQEQYEQWVRGGRLDPATQRPGIAQVNPQTGQPGPTPGDPMAVEAWQNHVIHVKQHDQWANSDRMRALTLADPIAHTEITMHRVQHIVASANPFGIPSHLPGIMPISPTAGAGTGVPAPPPPPPTGPQSPPPPKLAVSLALKGEDLLNPEVRQIINQEGLHVAPIAPLATHVAVAAKHAGMGQPQPKLPGQPAPQAPQPQGAGMAMENSNRESGAIDTLPGHPSSGVRSGPA